MISVINSELYEESLKVLKYFNIILVRIQVLTYTNWIHKCSQCRLYLPAFQTEIVWVI